MENVAAVPAPGIVARSLTSPMLRLLLSGVLILLFAVPMGMLRTLIDERQARRDAAVADIFASGGGRQSLTGPILRVPFLSRRLVTDADGKAVEQVAADAAYLLPQVLHAEASLQVQMRHRGIFTVPVYAATVRLQGRFERPDLAGWGVRPDDVDWRHAELLLGLSDPRSLHGDAVLRWGDHTLRPKPAISQSVRLDAPGVHVPLGEELGGVFESGAAEFSINFGLNGADSFHLAPTAEDTDLVMDSNWPHPSFQGDWLPVQREIRRGGFKAAWSVSYLGRDYPQRWRESAGQPPALFKTRFGVALATPVDPYTMAERLTKYAALTFALSFAVIWLTEVLSGKRVHLVQYGFVGAALCLFGLLQLSLAEHLGFTGAFVLAGGGVVIMVTLYANAILGRLTRALVVGGVLGGLYAYLYAILQVEDYALLGGSLALFACLGMAMYLTRRIDWFALGGGVR